MRIGVIGAGSWGTALANVLAQANHEVMLWAFEQEVVEDIAHRHANALFHPDVALAQSLRSTGSLQEAVEQAELVLCVTPSHVVRTVISQVADFIAPDVPVVSATKGIETETLLTMSAVLDEVLGNMQRIAVLSGPSFAADVIRRRPTAVTVAADSHALADSVRDAFSTDFFRVYSGDDRMGLELGGALKNVYAIAAGMNDALELGHNCRAALVTRGLAEMTRLGVAMGAHADTFAGLGGLGDLVLTCTGDQSRNRTVGLRLGRGEPLDAIMDGRHTVAEGVATTQAAAHLAKKHGVEMPIVTQIKAVLDGATSPRDAVVSLMRRDLKREYA